MQRSVVDKYFDLNPMGSKVTAEEENMEDRNDKKANRIKGMDLISDLLEEDLVRELNAGYNELLICLNGQKNNSLSDELGEILKEFKAQGMRYSTAPVVTGKGVYVRFVFRNRFIILFPYQVEGSIRLCKYKRELIGTKNMNDPNGEQRFLNQIRFSEMRRESIEDKDFFELEEMLKKIPGKIQVRKVALKPLF